MTLRRLILHNFGLKLVSLLLASLLWVAVNAKLDLNQPSARELAGLKVSRKFPQLPVLVMTQMADRRAYRAEPGQVDITVSGSASVVEQLQPSDLRVFVRLAAARELKQPLMLPVEIPPPRGVTVDKTDPAMVLVMPVESP